MRVLLLIDSLAPGGAQRQICLLANGLAERQHEVILVTYHAIDFFDYLVAPVVRLVRLGPHKKWKRVFLLRRAIRREKPEAVIAFLEASSLYAELGRLPWRKYRLIVSERNLDRRFGWFFRLKTVAHLFADIIAPNSKAQKEVLLRKAPWLKGKVRVVPNIVDTDRFRLIEATPRNDDQPFRFLTLGRYQGQKNGRNLLEGFSMASARSERKLTLDWYGNRFYDSKGDPTVRSHEYHELVSLSERLGISGNVRLEGAVQEVEKIYPLYDAFVLASTREGSPNVILEAMACGLPVIASDVADNAAYIQDKDFLFDPESPNAIKDTILRLVSSSHSRLENVRKQGRHFIETVNAKDVCVDVFESLLKGKH